MTNYDIHFAPGTELNFELRKLLRNILEQNNVRPTSGDHFPFIGLDVSAELAIALWKQLKANGVRSVVVPSVYRQPLLTVDEAFQFANSIFKEIKNQDPSDKFGDLLYVRKDMMWYTFNVSSLKLAKEGRTPAALFISIDTIDGHWWRGVQEIMRVTLDTWFF